MITIKNLNTTSRRATIDLDYEDALCLLNALYQVHSYSKILLLQSLLKHSYIPDWELQQIYRSTIGNKLPEEEYDG